MSTQGASEHCSFGPPSRRGNDARKVSAPSCYFQCQHMSCRVPLIANVIYLHHSHATVLDFGLAEEADGGLVALPPEVLVGQVEGIVELHRRVGLLGNGLQVGLGGRELGGGGLLRTGREGCGGAGEKRESGELHCWV